jgi:hypothetical protein
LVFLESWHEDVSEKDFVYPLGNVQYLGTTGDSGTPVAGAFAGFGTYSLFGNWQSSSALVGKGYVWSTLSDANKKAFVANPENNCYLDGDKVIQVRYRMRVVQGTGDAWAKIDPQLATDFQYTLTGNTKVISAKGKLVSSLDMEDVSGAYYTNVIGTASLFKDTGVFTAVTYASGTRPPAYNVAYEGKCFAMPIALVHRRNQGAYHPVYNSNGTRLYRTTSGAWVKWHQTSDQYPYSLSDSLPGSLKVAGDFSGAISGGIANIGRADGLFYDQVHEGDITDLRMSSQKVEDYNRLIDREFNKAVAGTVRGTEGEWQYKCEDIVASVSNSILMQAGGFSVIFNAPQFSNTVANASVGDLLIVQSSTDNTGAIYEVIFVNGPTTWIQCRYVKFDPTWWYSASDSYRKNTHAVKTQLVKKTTRTKSNTITHTDIIGSPASYPVAFKQSGVSGTPLIVAEGGTSLLPTGTTGSDGLAVYKLSRKANATPLQVLKSTNSGATWTLLISATHYTFSTTGNYIEFITGHRPLVADLIMVTYQTHTNIAVPAVNSEVLAIGDVLASSYSLTTYSNYLAQSLVGKVPVSSTIGSQLVSGKINGYTLDPIKFYPSQAVWSPQHSVINLPNNTSPAVKVFPYLTRSNGKAYLQLVFKEMKYGSYAAPTVDTGASISHVMYATYQVNIAGCPLDGETIQWTAATATAAINWALYNKNADGSLYVISSGAAYTNAKMFDGNSWGDDSKFNIVDNVSTTTDDNGATVLIGQKRIELPYFISAGE